MNNILFVIKNVAYKKLKYRYIEILKGKVNFIVGESGTGKSTLLKLLNKTISLDFGTILFNNSPIDTYDSESFRKDISLVSQEIFLFSGTIFDNFKMFYKLRQLDCPSCYEIESILNLCCLNLPLDKEVSTLSGGEKQRVYIALFISFKPKVLMLDEPTSSLDEKNSHQLISNIISFCQANNIELILISHNLGLISSYCENKIEILKESV